MRFGVSTVRPSEDAEALAHRMGHAGVTRVVVTRPDGTLVGLFFAADLPSYEPARGQARTVCDRLLLLRLVGWAHPVVSPRGSARRISRAVRAQSPQIQTPGPATRGPRSLQPQNEQARPVPLPLPMRRCRRWTGAIHS
jgi:hypothetical protein